MGFGVIVVPSLALRKCIVDQLLVHVLVDAFRPGDFGCNKNAVTKHELGGNIPESNLLREFVPHGTHERLRSRRGPLNRAVDVVDQVVSLVDSISNGLPHSIGLQPRLPIQYIERQID